MSHKQPSPSPAVSVPQCHAPPWIAGQTGFRGWSRFNCSTGAGSCLEALGLGKALLVVVNDTLMGNHQLELAKQLHKDSHLLYCTCRYVWPLYAWEVMLRDTSDMRSELFQHPDGDAEDYGPLHSPAVPTWRATALRQLPGQSSRSLMGLGVYRTAPFLSSLMMTCWIVAPAVDSVEHLRTFLCNNIVYVISNPHICLEMSVYLLWILSFLRFCTKKSQREHVSRVLHSSWELKAVLCF